MSHAKALDAARDFAASILHATDPMLDALTLACAVTHGLPAFTTVPRLFFNSTGPETGKTTALDVVRMLSQAGWMANGTSAALRAKFNEPVMSTVLFDEIQSVFGMSGRNGGNDQRATVIREGYRSSAKLSMSTGRVAEDVPCFGVVAFGGLRIAVPADIRTRCITFPMEKRPAGKKLRSSLDTSTEIIGRNVNSQLHGWVSANVDALQAAARDLGAVHARLTDRRRQVWVSLFAVAKVAGGTWPTRCLAAFKELGTEEQREYTLSQMVIRDAAALIERTGVDTLIGRDLIAEVRTISEEMYVHFTDRELALQFTAALGSTKDVRVGDSVAKGWDAAAVLLLAKDMHAELDGAEMVLDDADPFAGL